jgi:hypothetical protein
VIAHTAISHRMNLLPGKTNGDHGSESEFRDTSDETKYF